MQNIQRKKDFFEVPMQAILPHNWEKFYTNPNIGDDVPVNVGCGVTEFWTYAKNAIGNSLTAFRTYLSGSASNADKATYLFRWLIAAEMFYSNGNLISALGCHSGMKCRIVVKDSAATLNPLMRGDFDAFFDLCCSQFCSVYPNFTIDIDGDTRLVVVQPGNLLNASAGYNTTAISFHDFLSICVMTLILRFLRLVLLRRLRVLILARSLITIRLNCSLV